MGLIQRRTMADTQPLYRMGLKSNKLVVGLGNVGKEFDLTRHNVGFEVLDQFAKDNSFPAWHEKKDLNCLITTQDIGDAHVTLVKPTSMMNLSGQAVSKVQSYYRLSNAETLIVQDELDIAYGVLRCHPGEQQRGHAGHNGIKSLVSTIGYDFNRLRIGIAGEHKANSEGADYVLAKFSKGEQKTLPKIIKEAEVLINEFLAANSAGQRMPTDTRTIDL